jgi:signal transduction histidine kinase
MSNLTPILVVDDEQDLAFLIQQKFRRQIKESIYHFYFALNGVEALKLLKEHSEIELILTDINMPEMDGLTLLNEINAMKRPTKSVVISAYGDLNNIRTAMNRGAFDFITKPIDFNDLELTLQKTIEEHTKLTEGIKAQQVLTTTILEKDQAIQSAKFKQQFLANMSHEIRTPLNAIVGMTNLLLNETTPENQKRYLNAMKQASHNLLGLINDILDISKIEAGKINLETIDFNFYDVVDSVYQTLHLKADETSINLSYHIDERIPKWLNSDPTRISQILINLVGNAIKFTPANGSVTITCKLLEKLNDVSTILFQVKDTGIGISKEQQDNIFESFTQASNDTTRKFGGTGLGLTISKQLVELLNGEISIESELGKGTSFFFTLPFSEGIEVEEKSKKIENDQNQERTLTILLAEDQPMNQMVAVDTLEVLFPKSTIDVADNGKIAVELASNKKYDIIFMDIHMPVMDGYEATQQIIGGEGLSKLTPIIALTANVVKEEIDKCLEAGMKKHLAKPFNPDQLKLIVNEFA